MSVEKLIERLDKEALERFAMLDSDADKLLAIVKVQNEALIRIMGTCSDYQRGGKLAEEAITETDKIAREGV